MDVSNLSINNQNKLLEKYFPKSKTLRKNASLNRSSLEISDFSRQLQSSKVDLAKSNFNYENESLNFNVSFLKNTTEEFGLTGYFSAESKKSEVNLQYRFEKTVLEKGKFVSRTFEASFSMSFERESSIKMTKNNIKEDITEFIRRFTSEIISILNDKNKNLVSVVLSKEDIEDLTNIGDEKILEMITEIINVILTSAHMKKMLKNSSNAEQIVYQPKRKIDEVTTVENKFGSFLDYSFEIKEVKNQNSESDTNIEVKNPKN